MPFHPNPKKPNLKLPANACDAHCHVFGPVADFPFAAESKYTPVDAPKEKLFELHQHLGFEHSVIVQASCHGTNNNAMVDALKSSNGKYRGVAVVSEDITEAEIAAMHASGVRGIRFNFVKRLVDVKRREYYIKAAEKIAQFGWHIIVYFEPQDLKEQEGLFRSLPVPICIDHLGRPDVEAGLEHLDFQRIYNLVETRPDTWIKVGCPERLTKIGPYQVNDIGFGCMSLSPGYGAGPDALFSSEILNRVLDVGYNFLDTAALYGGGKNEELLGQFIMHRRHEFVLSSKCGLFFRNGDRVISSRPADIRQVCEDSLRRLKTELGEYFEIAEELGCTPAQLALAWLRYQRDFIIPIPATKKTDYLEENIAASAIEIDEMVNSKLNALINNSTVVGNRYNDNQQKVIETEIFKWFQYGNHQKRL